MINNLKSRDVFKALRTLLTAVAILAITSCNSLSVGGSVSGGSSSDVDVGVGVGIQL